MATLDPNKAPVVQLRSPEGDKIYPASSTEAFYDKNGNKVPLLLTYKVDGVEVSAPELTGAYDLAKLGGSNRNLLDNWDFRNPVNQRGVTAGTGSYFIDRWMGVVNSVTSDGLVVANTNYIVQNIEPSLKNVLHGKVVTCSIMYSDRTIESGSAVYHKDVTGFETVFSTENMGCAITYFSDDSRGNISFSCLKSKTIAAVKLELGAVSTLANDPLADYGEELRKCQRYYLEPRYMANKDTWNDRWSPVVAIPYDSDTLVINYQFPTTMRAVPTVKIYGGADALTENYLRDNSTGNAVAISGFTTNKLNEYGVGAVYKSGAFTVGHSYSLLMTFSADL